MTGEELRKIETQELFRVRYDSFKTYLRDRWRMNEGTAQRLMRVARTVAIIRDAGLPLPVTEEQASALA